jgi:hypothetical protein
VLPLRPRRTASCDILRANLDVASSAGNPSGCAVRTEVSSDTRVVTVDEHLRELGRDLETDAARRRSLTAALHRQRGLRRITWPYDPSFRCGDDG